MNASGINRHAFIYVGILLLFILSCGKKKADPKRNDADNRPNIIFLLTDDLRYDALGFMGNKNIQTPELDKLAAQGVYFLNAYHVSPICLPSRASIMLGQYLGTHGAGFDQPTNWLITEKEYKQSYPVLLKKAGYFTGFIGKFGFPVKGDHKVVSEGMENKAENLPSTEFDDWKGFPGQGAYLPKKGKFNGYDNKENDKHLNAFMGTQALEFLQKAHENGGPFCLSISFKAPHAPFLPEADMKALYDGKILLRMPNDNPEAFARLPEVVRTKSRNALRYFGKAGDPSWHIYKEDTYQEFIKNYYALISGVDRVVGRLRQALETNGYSENTIIVFTSDNGFFCGSRQLMGKALLYEESVKAPLIVFDPRNPSYGRVEKGFISLIDMAPTLLDYAHLKPPKEMQGKSFKGIVDNNIEEIRELVFGENDFDNNLPIVSEVADLSKYCSIRSKYVRTQKFKYIRFHECNSVIEELWDMETDSIESINLINDPTFFTIANDMRQKLDAFEKENVHYHNK